VTGAVLISRRIATLIRISRGRSSSAISRHLFGFTGSVKVVQLGGVVLKRKTVEDLHTCVQGDVGIQLAPWCCTACGGGQPLERSVRGALE